MNNDFKTILAVSNGMIRHHDVPDAVMYVVFEFLGDIREKYTTFDIEDSFIDIIRKDPKYPQYNMDQHCSKCKKCGTILIPDINRKKLKKHIYSKSCAKKSKKYNK